MSDDKERDLWFAREQKAYEQAMDEMIDEPGCTKKVGIRFYPYEDQDQFQLIAQFCCEDLGLPFLYNPDSQCWGCGHCNHQVPQDAAKAYVSVAKDALVQISKRQQPESLWQRFKKWFKPKKTQPLLKA